MRFEGKVAMITGGSSGIGKAIALLLASEGADIVLLSNETAPNEATAEEIRALGRKVLPITMDVSNTGDVEAAVKAGMETFGKIDILINNAGITRDNLLIRMSDEEWDDVMRINLKGAFLMSRAIAKPMMKARAGAIVNTASVIGLIGNAGQCNYAASKAGMIALTKSMAKELASRGIRVNAIAPGFIVSRMTDALPEAVKAKMLEGIPLGRLGTTDDIARSVAFLASDDASYITGQTLNISGGMVI